MALEVRGIKKFELNDSFLLLKFFTCRLQIDRCDSLDKFLVLMDGVSV